MDIPQKGVFIDARGAQAIDSADRGIGRFVFEHIKALLRLRPEAIGAIGYNPDLPLSRQLESLSGSGLLEPISSSAVGDQHPAIYHVMSPFELTLDVDEIWPESLRGGDTRLVVTLHDLIPLVLRDAYEQMPDWGFIEPVWQARLGLVRAADHLLTNSRHTAEDATRYLGIPEERITPIESGVPNELADLVATRSEAEAVLKRFRRLRAGFLLYVGGEDPRKNLEGTLRGYAQLPEDLRRAHQLVIACKLTGLRRLQLRREARRLGIRHGDLVLTGFVPDRELGALYRSCELFVFPSLYEGAGLPILEAMACDAPVAASRTSAMPELLGDERATFDPRDPADIARCISEVVDDRATLESLRERSRERVAHYTWERVAERSLEGYQRALERPLHPKPSGSAVIGRYL
jgi:glycosyltransferase involved in cell wall biosynthesis